MMKWPLTMSSSATLKRSLGSPGSVSRLAASVVRLPEASRSQSPSSVAFNPKTAVEASCKLLLHLPRRFARTTRTSSSRSRASAGSLCVTNSMPGSAPMCARCCLIQSPPFLVSLASTSTLATATIMLMPRMIRPTARATNLPSAISTHATCVAAP